MEEVLTAARSSIELGSASVGTQQCLPKAAIRHPRPIAGEERLIESRRVASMPWLARRPAATFRFDLCLPHLRPPEREPLRERDKMPPSPPRLLLIGAL